MKRITIVFDCGCSVAIWAQASVIKESRHNCEEHQRNHQQFWRWCQEKTIAVVSAEPHAPGRIDKADDNGRR